MKTIAHISDIHFGRVDKATVKPLIAAIQEAAPHVVVISGDLTQRARINQFIEARDFLAQLPAPQIIVPGNHDVPLYNVLHRFLGPLENYRRYITNDLEPFYLDNEIAVLGINTARSLTFKDGRISREQILSILERFCDLERHIVKILVTHHPLDLPSEIRTGRTVGRADITLEALAACGADLLLAGHYHWGETGSAIAGHQITGYTPLLIHAGTAASTRGRGQSNSFNIIKIDAPMVSVERMAWRQEVGRFEVALRERFERTEGGWRRLEKGASAP